MNAIVEMSAWLVLTSASILAATSIEWLLLRVAFRTMSGAPRRVAPAKFTIRDLTPQAPTHR